ncbi:hypothetical protein KAFR_0C03130 [Kazachstania africana CBS 2517]|uniref:Uncharacterized protein n=1 Tax=Kazachstania africana (strain ATCC 22294 / BCRC 22015 / CBS 2517 / CECT 1963 / NBRC 1671 / NRRL Y-8276) TaxID=1071382 RepID=H2ASF5_KAZAF|nr:hypothetical protein KAFR_0C03130 [Kazachstania africana CBS 2517]CCF57305.1 hypothetical protein KAFR_0C03130 [Kazachstania africana CBS 2517]
MKKEEDMSRLQKNAAGLQSKLGNLKLNNPAIEPKKKVFTHPVRFTENHDGNASKSVTTTMSTSSSSSCPSASNSTFNKTGSIEKDISSSSKDTNYNENNRIFHLRLALEQKEKELKELKSGLNQTILKQNDEKIPNLRHPIVSRERDTRKINTRESLTSDSPIRSSTIYGVSKPDTADIISHVSASPYNGSRSGSLKTETSVATTNMSQMKKDRKLLKDIIIPYIHCSIKCFESSVIFHNEANHLSLRFKEIMELQFDEDYKTQLLIEILDNLSFLQRQQTAFLNEELREKKISKQLDSIFESVLNKNWREINDKNQLSKIKEEVFKLLCKSNDLESINQDKKKNILDDQPFSTASVPTINSKVYANVNTPRDINDDQSNTNAYVEDKLTEMSTNSRKSQYRKSMEFVPIGYDNKSLYMKTPQRLGMTRTEEISPLGPNDKTDENSPLQILWQER